jgi:uncharacterized protein (TIGR02147 family)
MFIAGKRNLKPATAGNMGTALALDPDESEYFVRLVAYTQSPTRKRTKLRLELLEHAIRSGGTNALEEAHLAYFRHWYIPAVHAMASLAGFQPDAKWIARRFDPPLGVREAKKALATLENLGIFSKENGGFTVKQPRLETAPGLRSSLIREYHRATIRLADAALEYLPVEKRMAAALTVTVPDSMTAELYQRIDQFRSDLYSWLMASQADTDGVPGEVVQVNLLAFPLTKADR